MQENNYEYHKRELAKALQRRNELKRKGAKALSRYDIEIAHQGNASLVRVGEVFKEPIRYKQCRADRCP
jgi:hypothetical protein